MSKKKKVVPTYTLFTNISFVQIGDLRLECSALLIEKDIDAMFGGTATRMRGFGPDGAWPVFTQWLTTESLPYVITSKVYDSDVQPLSLDGSGYSPIFYGSLLKLADGKEYFLQAEDSSQPLDEVRETNILRVWTILAQKAAKYWHAPNTPRLVWGLPRPKALT